MTGRGRQAILPMAEQVVYCPWLSVLQQYGAAPLPQVLLCFTVVGCAVFVMVFVVVFVTVCVTVFSGGQLLGSGAGAPTALPAKRRARARMLV